MGKHSKLFNSQNDYDSFILSDEFVLPNVSYIVENDTVNFHPYVIMDYNSQYLMFEAIEDSKFKLSRNDCQCSKDGGKTWGWLFKDTNVTVSAGSKIMFKATTPSISSTGGMGTFSSTGKFNVSGNIMSMLYGDDFVDKIDLTYKDYAFYNLFNRCTNLVEAHNLILPATTLDDYCYQSMFDSCTSLTSAPELPATTLTNYCYRSMFSGCSSLNKITMLATNIRSTDCLKDWVSGVASTGTFVKHPDMTSLPSGISGIPKGWTVEDYQE